MQDHVYTVFRENASDYLVAKPLPLLKPPSDSWADLERLVPGRRKAQIGSAKLLERLKRFPPEHAPAATEPVGGDL